MDVTLKSVFLSYKSKVKMEGSQRLTFIDRNNIFRECLSFYKIACADLGYLKKYLIVDFIQELGIDAGAVKIEMLASFFKAALKEMLEPLSESDYILKRSMTIFLCKLLGLATAHCFLQNGLPFQGLSRWCYDFLIEEDEDIIYSQLNAKDFPLNSGTLILNYFSRNWKMLRQTKS